MLGAPGLEGSRTSRKTSIKCLGHGSFHHSDSVTSFEMSGQRQHLGTSGNTDTDSPEGHTACGAALQGEVLAVCAAPVRGLHAWPESLLQLEVAASCRK